MTGYTHHMPKLVAQTNAAEIERESLSKALHRAILAQRLVEHPHYSGA